MCIAARKNDGSTKIRLDIEQVKEAFSSILFAVRKMLTPHGMLTLDNRGPTRDEDLVRLCLSSNTRLLGRDSARSNDRWFLLVLAMITYTAFLICYCTATAAD